MIILWYMREFYAVQTNTCINASVEIQLSPMWLLFAPAFHEIGCRKK